MIKITVKVEGMACSMCEAHVNDAVRGAFRVKKVKSSHKKGETVILSEEPIGEAELTAVLGKTGYIVRGVQSEPYQKRCLFRR